MWACVIVPPSPSLVPEGAGGFLSPQELGMHRSSCSGCRRKECVRCAWTELYLSSLCPVATWSVPSVLLACNSAPSVGHPSVVVCAPSCPRPGKSPELPWGKPSVGYLSHPVSCVLRHVREVLGSFSYSSTPSQGSPGGLDSLLTLQHGPSAGVWR